MCVNTPVAGFSDNLTSDLFFKRMNDCIDTKIASHGAETMTTISDKDLGAFRAQLAGLLFLRHLLWGLAAWAMMYGVVVLFLRGAVGLEGETLLWGVASLPLLLVVASVQTYRGIPRPTRIKALLDRYSLAGGLLMASEETSLGPWQIDSVLLPRVRWHPRRSGLSAAIALIFLVLAFLVPAGWARMDSPRLDVRRDAERLAEQLAVLKEEKILDEQRANELKEKLDQLRKDALARDPVKTLEALDFLRDTTQKNAHEAAEKAARKSEEMALAAELAERLMKRGDQLNAQQLAEAMNEVAKMTRKAGAENGLLSEELDQELLDQLNKGLALNKEQMKKLGDALKNAKGNLSKKVGKLVKAKLVDPDALSKCEKCGECDNAALAKYLKENGNGDLAALLAEGDGEAPAGLGQGSVTRGPGHAKLTFGDESSKQGVKFKDEILPPSDLRSVRDSQLQGISSGAPSVQKPDTQETTSSALNRAKTGGGSSAGQTVLPRHRSTVERFFERPSSPPKQDK